MAKFKIQNLCRICKSSSLTEYLNLGETPLANSFLTIEDLQKKEDKYPLTVLFCNNCKLSQLSIVVSPEILFRDYVYFSSNMPILPQHFKKYAEEVVKNFTKSKNDLVVEIGSNDGLLLGAIKSMGVRVLGVDPAVNIAKVANERGIETLAEFFSEGFAQVIYRLYGFAKVIIGNNVVAHIDNHHDLVKGVNKLLTDDGVFIFEAPYLVDMFENLTFDTIYHEHLSYLSIGPLIKLFESFDLEIFNVKIFPVQGNSIRTYVGRKGVYKINSSVDELVRKEKKLSLDNINSYHQLTLKIAQLKEQIRSTLFKLKKQHKRIAAYGAPAKGNTLLNYFGFDSSILEYATEELPSKVGFFTPGTRIPVVHIDEARENLPDYFLLLAWNYKNSALEKEKDFRKKGGKFIIPVGNGEII